LHLSLPLVSHYKTESLWLPPSDELSLSFAPTTPLPLSGPRTRLRSHSRLLLNVSHSPPADRFQLTCSVSQPTLTAQPFPCGLISGWKPSGLRPTPTYHFTCTYIHLISHLTTPLSHTRQLSAPRHRHRKVTDSHGCQMQTLLGTTMRLRNYELYWLYCTR